ncbi:MAG: PAS domain S-box protein [Sterolibacteriaceae bacterium]|nr:PAS domain S-box protein [Sterolibacteriaceae bacterium]
MRFIVQARSSPTMPCFRCSALPAVAGTTAASPQGIARRRGASQAGIIISVNPAFTRITGYAPNEVIGHTPRILSSRQQDKASTIHRRPCIEPESHATRDLNTGQGLGRSAAEAPGGGPGWPGRLALREVAQRLKRDSLSSRQAGPANHGAALRTVQVIASPAMRKDADLHANRHPSPSRGRNVQFLPPQCLGDGTPT